MVRLQTDQNAAPHAVTGNTVGQVRQSVVVVAADGDVSDVEENAECAEDDEQYSDDS